MIGDQITIEIILETFEWDSFEQQNFWAIASSESLIHISLQQTFCRVFVELFKTWQSSGMFNHTFSFFEMTITIPSPDHPEASLGILNLLRSDPIFAGSEPLVGALLSQPAFAESPFMIAVLNTWACVPGLPTVLDKSINKVIKSGDPTILTNLDKWKAQRRK
jgi:hypothetical protein